MSLRFVDSFDHYASGSLTEKWTSLSGSGVTVSAGSGRRGTQAAKFIAQANYLQKTLDAQATWVFGFAFQASALPGGVCPILQVIDASTVQVDIRLNTDGTVSITRNGTALTSGTSTLSILANTYYYFEFQVTISSSISANTCQLNVNGVNWVNVATGQSTKASANATANTFKIGIPIGVSSAPTVYLDDLYVTDGQGSVNNGSFLGDCAVSVLYPNGAGNYTQWTPDSGTNYTRVDETIADEDASYVETGTAGNIDSYAFAGIVGSPASIFGVAWNAELRKTDASTYNVRRLFRSGGTDYIDTNDISAPSSYTIAQKILETNPATSAAWTASDLEASEWGQKLNSIV